MTQPTLVGITLTEWIIILTTVFLCVYDVAAKIFFGDDGTITFTIQKWMEKDYKLAVLGGLIFGHIFLSNFRYRQ